METMFTRFYSMSIGLVYLLVTCSAGHNSKAGNHEYFPGRYPGQPNAVMSRNQVFLSNEVISAQWELKANSILLRRVINHLDGDTIHLENISLFAVELANGKTYTNREFKLKGELFLTDLMPTDSLPTASLRFYGKRISGLFISTDRAITIQWTAQLRDGSNYIRQNIILRSTEQPIAVSKIVFYDGMVPGCSMGGTVLGSPIWRKHVFFALERPMAQSKALTTGKIGDWSGLGPGNQSLAIKVDKLVSGPGEYVVAIEHGYGPADFNVESMIMLEDERPVIEDIHPLNGPGGQNLYHLTLDSYDPTASYQIVARFNNSQGTSGTLHMYRKTDHVLNFFVERTDTLKAGSFLSLWSAIGVCPENQKRRAFLYYLERERARPYQQFLHYNCWWDITTDGASSFSSDQLLERMDAWNDKFISPYKVKLNAFVFDDGWDDLNRVWYFDLEKFPNGFAPQAELCKRYQSGIGVWMSPFGGYLENKEQRIRAARKEGLEINAKGLSLAGPKYYRRFYERALDMVKNYKVNYFKFDGFGGFEPQYLPDMEAGARLIKSLRLHDPNLFINITVGSWSSPFWLMYADCTWRGSADALNAGVGSKTQQFITYRDGTLHNNVVMRAPYYPLNSIMVVGIAFANQGLARKFVNDDLDDFKDMVRSFFGSGTSLQELYISYDRMQEDFWPVLAEAAIWARVNEDVLKDVHWIGGSPINLEVYGFASWKAIRSRT